MKKQKIQFILLCVVLLAFVGVFFGLREYNRRQSDQKTEDETPEIITAASIPTEEIQEFTYQYEDKDITFLKEKDTWYNKADKKIKIEQSMITSMLGGVGEITAEQKFSDVKDTAEYGFDKPLNTITLKTAEEEYRIVIGMHNEITNQYYLMVNDDKNIYLTDASIYLAFQKSVEDLTEPEEETPSN